MSKSITGQNNNNIDIDICKDKMTKNLTAMLRRILMVAHLYESKQQKSSSSIRNRKKQTRSIRPARTRSPGT